MPLYRACMTFEIHIALLIALAAVILVVGLLIGRALVLRNQRAAAAHAPEATGTSGAGVTDPSEDGTVHEPEPEPEPVRRDRAALVINPTKAGADEVRRLLLRISREEDWDDPLVLETTEDDPGEGPAREAVEQGVTVVIAAGGDGTVRAVAGVLTGTEVALGIVPLGTGNLLARNLDIVLDRHEWALRTALTGRSALIDTGKIRIDPEGDAHTFLVMAGIGFDAEVMGSVNEDLKDKMGWLAYVEAGSRSLLGHRVDVTISSDDGEEREAKIRSVVAGNCGRLQGGLWLFPDAVIDDGLDRPPHRVAAQSGGVGGGRGLDHGQAGAPRTAHGDPAGGDLHHPLEGARRSAGRRGRAWDDGLPRADRRPRVAVRAAPHCGDQAEHPP